MPSRETQPSVEQERISSSVPIHWMPASAMAGIDALADRAFRGPHAARLLAEQLLVEFHRPADVLAWRPRRSLPGAWAASRWASPGGPAACPTAAAGSDDRTAWWSTRPGPRSSSSRCSGTTCSEQLHLLVQQPLLLLLRPAAALVAELGQLGVLLERQRMDPHQVRPALQVDDVFLVEPLAGLFGRIDPTARASCTTRDSAERAGSSGPGGP